ncbi:MAG: GNAT family N-acetyltransferase [Angustibacter sp.]
MTGPGDPAPGGHAPGGRAPGGPPVRLAGGRGTLRLPSVGKPPGITPDALRHQAVRDGVTVLLQQAVTDGAALGWEQPPRPQQVAELLQDVRSGLAEGRSAVAVRIDGDGRVVGFGYWRRYARQTRSPHADLERLAVAAEHRRRGVGRAVLRELVAAARAWQIELLTLDVRADHLGAQALYRSEGFVEYGRLAGLVASGDRRWASVLMARRLTGAILTTDTTDTTGTAAPAAGGATGRTAGSSASPDRPAPPRPAGAEHLCGWLVLRRDDGRVLLARRSAHVAYGAGLWGLPGGHVHRGERFGDAAVRETREEIGVHVRVADAALLGVQRYEEPGTDGVDAFFLARRWDGVPAPLAECSEVAWFDPARPPPDALPWLAGSLRTHLLGRTPLSELLWRQAGDGDPG